MPAPTEFELAIHAALSEPSGAVNDDRVGQSGNVAWVIDGATDVGDGPLVGDSSDAAWLADTISNWLLAKAAELPADLAELPAAISAHAEREFARLCRRQPQGRHEHPSASGLIIRVAGSALEYVAVGDCTLLVADRDGRMARYGIGDDDAGDPWLVRHLKSAARETGQRTAGGLRASIMPVLRTARERMNCVPGYGVFSITAPPVNYIETGRIAIAPDSRALVASDGFMRLADVYGVVQGDDLLAETFARGPDAMLRWLREIEADDADCRRYARAKVSDDASVIIATVGAL